MDIAPEDEPIVSLRDALSTAKNSIDDASTVGIGAGPERDRLARSLGVASNAIARATRYADVIESTRGRREKLFDLEQFMSRGPPVTADFREQVAIQIVPLPHRDQFFAESVLSSDDFRNAFQQIAVTFNKDERGTRAGYDNLYLLEVPGQSTGQWDRGRFTFRAWRDPAPGAAPSIQQVADLSPDGSYFYACRQWPQSGEHVALFEDTVADIIARSLGFATELYARYSIAPKHIAVQVALGHLRTLKLFVPERPEGTTIWQSSTSPDIVLLPTEPVTVDYTDTGTMFPLVWKPVNAQLLDTYRELAPPK